MTNSDQDISLVKAENIEKTYGKKAVVRGVSYELRQGEVVGLLGPNGAGKTTSFYMIVGVVKPSRGKVLFDGKDITGYAMYKRARMGISYLPQEPSIFRKMTVENNIMA
ncbi:MAG TPA: ATP-binding cassette domain-containing protein, partial [Candidatus Kapabacteria bacterium]|nr:ATP-binding cassette domain-containing protein [Candidatus Kapabacteria bacterium]